MPEGIPLKRFTVLALVAAIIAVALVAGAVIIANLPEADEPERLTRQLQIDASKEKTHFTGPFRSDGTLDYRAAINQQQSEGITPENNAFRELAKVLRPQDAPERYPELLRALDISEKEMKLSPSFTTWDNTYRHYIHTDTDASKDETKVLLEEIFDAPLTDETSQMLTKWVQLNHEALAHCDEALARERYWAPLVDWPGGNDLLVSLWQPHSDLIRELAWAYRSQLMLAAIDGDANTATNALRSMLRLAKLQSNEASLIGGLIAISVEAQAIFAVRDLLNQGLLNESMANQFAEVWGPTDGRVPITRHIDTWERFMLLDGLMQVASGRSDTNEIIDGLSEQRLIDQLFVDERFDINAGLTIVQADFNRLIHAMKQDGYATCAEALVQLEADFEQRRDMALTTLIIPTADENLLNNQMVNPEHTEALTHYYLTLTMAALAPAYQTDLRVTANYRNCRVAIAVERYLFDRGQLPDSLEQLTPTYLATIPLDPFDQKPLKYLRIENGYSVYSLGDNLRDDEGVHNFDDRDIAIMVERFTPTE